MCYYTITLDHHAKGGGYTRAIMITDAEDETVAKGRFVNTFGSEYLNSLDLVEGIHIKDGFDRLLTDQAKKYILKVKNKAEDAPPKMLYQNMIHLNYA